MMSTDITSQITFFSNAFKILIRHHCTRKTFTYGKKFNWLFIKQCVPVGNHIVTSQYPVNSFTYGGIYSPFAAFTLFLALIHQILSHHATSHVILADQKWNILKAFNKTIYLTVINCMVCFYYSTIHVVYLK